CCNKLRHNRDRTLSLRTDSRPEVAGRGFLKEFKDPPGHSAPIAGQSPRGHCWSRHRALTLRLQPHTPHVGGSPGWYAGHATHTASRAASPASVTWGSPARVWVTIALASVPARAKMPG